MANCDFTIYGNLTVNQNITFIADSTLLTHKWFIDDMQVGTFSSLTINFSTAKDYTIRHEGVDQYMSTCSVTKTITITPLCNQPSSNLVVS